MSPDTNSRWADGSIWDENGKLLPGAQTYSDNTTAVKINHPLMIMVKEQRVVSLAAHYDSKVYLDSFLVVRLVLSFALPLLPICLPEKKVTGIRNQSVNLCIAVKHVPHQTHFEHNQ